MTRGARESFWGAHLVGLGFIGGSLTAAVRTEDIDFQKQVQDHKVIGGADKAGSLLGMPYTQFGMVGLTYGAGRLFPHSGLSETSELMLESLCVSSAATFLLKIAVNRERPDGSNQLSFPSNHASGSFALATTLQLRHGLKAGVPSYLLASFVSYSRIQENKHFASDTVFGAVLGVTVAHATWKVHREEASQRALLLPIWAGSSGGAALLTRF